MTVTWSSWTNAFAGHSRNAARSPRKRPVSTPPARPSAIFADKLMRFRAPRRGTIVPRLSTPPWGRCYFGVRSVQDACARSFRRLRQVGLKLANIPIAAGQDERIAGRKELVPDIDRFLNRRGTAR